MSGIVGQALESVSRTEDVWNFQFAGGWVLAVDIGDVSITLTRDRVLETWTDSAGYEPWMLRRGNEDVLIGGSGGKVFGQES